MTWLQGRHDHFRYRVEGERSSAVKLTQRSCCGASCWGWWRSPRTPSCWCGSRCPTGCSISRWWPWRPSSPSWSWLVPVGSSKITHYISLRRARFVSTYRVADTFTTWELIIQANNSWYIKIILRHLVTTTGWFLSHNILNMTLA